MRAGGTKLRLGMRASSASVVVLGWCTGCAALKDSPTSSERAATNESESSSSALDAAAPMPPEPIVAAANDCATFGGFTIPATAACYMLGDTIFSWQDARNFCQAWGGDLVEIDAPEENTALAERIQRSVWIGATDQNQEGVFRWAGGSLLDYAAWAAGQPNNLRGTEDCSELRAIDHQWTAVACTGDIARQALCERLPGG